MAGTFVDLFTADPVLVQRGVTPMHGWRNAGGSVFRPQGIAIHHTAGSQHGGPTASLNVVCDGRQDVPPPLCNLYVSRAGGLFIVSGNKANHAGKCSSVALAEVAAGKVGVSTGSAKDRGLHDDTVGNISLYGIEVENDGTGNEPWPAAVVDTVARACAALCRANHWSVGHITEHRKLTARKVDPVGRIDWWTHTAAYLAGDTNPKLILHTPDGRLLAWSGAMKDGARIVRHIQTIPDAEALLAAGWHQVDYSGTVAVTG